DRLEESATDAKNPFLLGEVFILRTRLEVAQGLSERVATSPQKPPEAFPSAGEHGEYLGVRGLALAAIGESRACIDTLETAQQTSRANEVGVLTACATAVLGMQKTEVDADIIRAAVEVALKTGHVDALVYAYRACPPLL